MKKLSVLIIASALSLSMLAGCGEKQQTNGAQTEAETQSDSTTVPEDSEPEAKTEPDSAPTSEAESESEATSEQEPEQTETPIVEKIGTVDEDAYAKAVDCFTAIVHKLRDDGLVEATDICVTMEGNTLKADMTFSNSTTDLVLTKDTESGEYTLALDMEFLWLEGFSDPINGIDPALYFEELTLAMLSMISDQPQALFDTIDQLYFSSFSISQTEWTAVGDCYMLDGGASVPDAYSFKFKK